MVVHAIENLSARIFLTAQRLSLSCHHCNFWECMINDSLSLLLARALQILTEKRGEMSETPRQLSIIKL